MRTAYALPRRESKKSTRFHLFDSGLILLAVFLLFILISPQTAYSAQTPLEWDANREPDLAGYRIHYGVASRNYDTIVDIGNYTSCTISELQEGQTYYFAVTAYDQDGNESGYSNEVTAFLTTEEDPLPEDNDEVPLPEDDNEVPVPQDNLALNKPVTSSGNEYTSGTYTKINDGIVNEVNQFWAAGGTPNWVVIDLEATYTVDRIKVNPFGRASSVYWYESAWNVKYATESDPNTFLDFTSPVKLSGAAPLAGSGISIVDGDPGTGVADRGYQYYEFTFDPVNVRYIRFEVTRGDKDGDANLDEIEVLKTF